MREIEFRAWDNKEQRWLFDGTEMDLQYSGESGAIMFDNDAYTGRSDSLTWVQYTGLKDKNGKKIFEGDIVKCVALRDDHGQRGAIDFQQIVISMGNSCLTFRGSDNGTPIYPFIVTHEIEVIGDIYENPELLATQEETA